MNEFKIAQVTKITGVKRARLQTWIDNGWITPSIQADGGAGVKNVFSVKDLYFIAIFKRIVEIGLPRKQAFMALLQFKENPQSRKVKIDGQDYSFVFDVKALIDNINTMVNYMAGKK